MRVALSAGMDTRSRVAPVVALALGGLSTLFLLSPAALAGAGQQGGLHGGTSVPIHGHTGTLALPGNVDQIYDGAGKIVVATEDGVRHVFGVGAGTKVHGADTLASLSRGTPVVVHYTMKGDVATSDEIDSLAAGGLKTTEGVVTAVDRVRKTITVKYPSGTSETLRLTTHAVSENGAFKGRRVIVYYTDESGQKIAHYFKRKS